MKYLTLLRHAKSSHTDYSLEDRERPLSARGLRDASAMGRHLDATFRFAPDRLISSPAVRTLQTARLIASENRMREWEIIQQPNIYEAEVWQLTAVVRAQPEEATHVCMVGHNPGTERFTNWLCGETVVEGVVTCAVVMLELAVERWQDVDAGTGKLREYLYPSLLGFSD